MTFPFTLSTVMNYGVTSRRSTAALVLLVYLHLLASAVLLGTEVNAIDLNGRAPSEVNVRTTSRE